MFISYARSSASHTAHALYMRLGGTHGAAFFDTSDIELGRPFPEILAAALSTAKVVVIFADDGYFQRPFCLSEFTLALAPFAEGVSVGEGGHGKAAAAIGRIVVALPRGPLRASWLDCLPAALRGINWPYADDTEALARLVEARLKASPSETRRDHSRAAWSPEEDSFMPQITSAEGIPVSAHGISSSSDDDLVGRANELWLIHHVLSTMPQLPGGSGQASLVITGLGGLGKTRLAAEYFHRFGPTHFPGGLFWIDADEGERAVERQQQNIIAALDATTSNEAPSPRDDSIAVRLSAALRSSARQRPILVVVDNVPEVGHPKSLEHWCPSVANVKVLATSRRKLELGQSVYSLSLLPLATDPGVRLLQHGLSRSSIERLHDDEWRSIAGWVGGLPLALRLLNRLLRGPMSPEAVSTLTTRRGPAGELEAAMKALRPHVPKGSLRGIAETFTTSFQGLSARSREGARTCAHLSPAPIPFDLAEYLMHLTVRTELVARGFLLPVVSREVPLWGRMHRVLADFLTGVLPGPTQRRRTSNRNKPSRRSATSGDTDGTRAALQLLASALVAVSSADAKNPVPWEAWMAWLPHVEWIIDKAMKVGPDLVGSAIMQELFQRSAEALDDESSRRGSRIGTTSPLAEAQRRMGEEEGPHPTWVMDMYLMAARLAALGDLAEPSAVSLTFWSPFNDDEQAAELQRTEQMIREAFAERKRLLGDDHYNTIQAQGDLACGLLELGRYEEALALLEDLWPRCRRIFGDVHTNSVRTAWNLIWAQFLTSNPDRAGYTIIGLVADPRTQGQVADMLLAARNALEQHAKTAAHVPALLRAIQARSVDNRLRSSTRPGHRGH